MPRKKNPDLSPEEQRRRFEEAAKAIQADESGQEFEKAFKKAVPPASKKSTKR